MNEKLAQAMDYVGDRHIAQAAVGRRRRRRLLFPLAAAVLAAVLVMHLADMPQQIRAQAISLASESRLGERPERRNYEDYAQYAAVFDPWQQEQMRLSTAAAEAGELMRPFLQRASVEVLGSASGENRVWSPLNAYIALAMLAETTGGESRAQILNLLGADDLETLRGAVSALWETTYTKDGKEISVLANSLWLDEGLRFRQQVMDDLAFHHYASVYQGELSSSQTTKDMTAWVSNATRGFLDDALPTEPMSEETALVLLSTIYFQSKWVDDFSRSENTQGLFHSPDGDISCTFMNGEKRQMNYYWGDSYGAVSLPLKNDSQVWLILPDEDKNVEQVLTEGQYLEMLLTTDETEEVCCKYVKVNLSVPKFDVQTQHDLRTSLQALGVTHIFCPDADFSPSLESDRPIWVDAVEQTTRVIIDEEGVTAGSYIVIPGAGKAAPPEEIIDFVLDRPFLFAITGGEGQILFSGVVNRP